VFMEMVDDTGPGSCRRATDIFQRSPAGRLITSVDLKRLP